jgi:voltage-gated potassium channel
MVLLLAVTFGLTSATVILHALGTLGTIGHLARIWRQKREHRKRLASEIQLVRTVSVLLLLHFLEAGIWAGLYRLLGLLPDMETAVYFSLTSYTTLGYGDVVLPSPWRLLGPIEAAVGILMFGWSTAIIVAVTTQVYRDCLRLPANPPAEGKESE